jgi:hypothetical protein
MQKIEVMCKIFHKLSKYKMCLPINRCQSQSPRGLRHEMSPPAETLGSWVRIPLEEWMSVRVSSVLVCPVKVTTLRRADHPSKESYRLCKIHSSRLILMGNRPEGLIRQGSRSRRRINRFQETVIEELIQFLRK